MGKGEEFVDKQYFDIPIVIQTTWFRVFVCFFFICMRRVWEKFNNKSNGSNKNIS